MSKGLLRDRDDRARKALSNVETVEKEVLLAVVRLREAEVNLRKAEALAREELNNISCDERGGRGALLEIAKDLQSSFDGHFQSLYNLSLIAQHRADGCPMMGKEDMLWFEDEDAQDKVLNATTGTRSPGKDDAKKARQLVSIAVATRDPQEVGQWIIDLITNGQHEPLKHLHGIVKRLGEDKLSKDGRFCVSHRNLTVQLGRFPTANELGEDLDLDPKRVRDRAESLGLKLKKQRNMARTKKSKSRYRVRS